MNRAHTERHHLTILVPMVFLAILMITLTGKPVRGEDESITVSCFKGNLEEGNYVGNVTVTVPANAGQSCNSTYYDCEGKCLGCFTDPKLDRQVCYDDSGQKLLK